MREPSEGIAPADHLLEAAYRAEFAPEPQDPDSLVVVDGRPRRVGELRALAMHDLAQRIDHHSHLRRADDTARQAALRFVERRLGEAQKVQAYDQTGSFQGFLRRVINNLLLDWLRSPTGKAELRRAEHDGADGDGDDTAPELPREEFERRRLLMLHNVIALRAIQAMTPGRGVPLRLALWPAYELDLAEIDLVASFAHCHETAQGQAEARACDSGKRCGTPGAAWRAAYQSELDLARETEPGGLSRRAVAELTRIGLGKPIAKREGAICERISKGRLHLLQELRRAGIRGTA
jgi:hypothetical protein